MNNIEISVPIPYQNLQELLTKQLWQEANQETMKIMLQIVGREEEGWLDEPSIKILPCDDLRIIDQLWLKYSDSRFGLSVQKNIWLNQCGGQIDQYDYDAIEKLGEIVGWKQQGKWTHGDSLQYSSSMPPGYLPLVTAFSIFGWLVVWPGEFFSRMAECNI